MARYYAKRTDGNELPIVGELLKIPGLSVERDHHDLLVGYKGKTYWYEVKEKPTSGVRDSQYKLAEGWKGHYKFAFSAEDILEDIGITKKTPARVVFNAIWHGRIRRGDTPAVANKIACEGVERYKTNQFETTQLLIEELIK